jgi:hypothetical protein
MGYYDLAKEERAKLVQKMVQEIERDLNSGKSERIKKYASDSDTYIRKNTYIIIGKLYRNNQDLTKTILHILKYLFPDTDEKVRQTVVYALGEIFLHHHDPKIRREIVHGIELRGRTHPEEILDVHKR